MNTFYYITMRILLEPEAYAEFSKTAKALGLSTRELGSKILSDYIKTTK